MMGPGEQEMERLRDALEQAKVSYEAAKAEHDLAIQRMRELGLTHPDGSIQHATQVYNFTLEGYKKALFEFNRFILGRKPLNSKEISNRDVTQSRRSKP